MIFKSIKKAFAWVAVLLVIFVLLIGGGYLALRTPKVQTKITQYIAGILSDELETEVTVGGVDIGFFNRLILEDLFVRDLESDTLAFIHDLHLGLKTINIEKNRVYFSKIRIDDLKFYLQKYEEEEKLNIQFLIDYFSSESEEPSAKWDIRFDEVELLNAAFKLRNHHAQSTSIGVDYKDLDVRSINLLIDDIRIDVDTIYGNIARLNCREDRGFFLKQFAGKAKVSPTELQVKDLEIHTATTDLFADLHYTYKEWADYKKFIENVNMDYVIRKSVINMNDVAFFAPALNGLKEKLTISGHVYGSIASLNGRDLNIWYGNSTNLQGDVDMDGLPNMNETFLHFNLKRLVSNYKDLTSIPLPPFEDGKKLSMPANIARLGTLNFKGSFTGFVNDFVAYGRLQTDIGQLRTDISLKQNDQTGILAYDGSLKSIEFNIGKFLDTDKLGRVTLDAKVTGQGLSKEDINAKLVGQIQSAKLVGYEYKNIIVNGTFAKSKFDGELSIADENVDLIFLGAFDLSQKLPEFNFHSDIKHANLYELNLLRKRENATVSGVLDVNFKGDDIDNILGDISIANARYKQKGEKEYVVPSFNLTVNEDSLYKNLRLRSAVLDADFSGIFNFRNIPKAVNNLLQKHLPSYASEFNYLKPDEGLEFDFDIELKKTEILSYFLAPKLSISDSSRFQGNYSSSKNEVYLRGQLSEAAYGGTILENVQIEAENPGSEFQLGVYSDKVNFSDSLYLANLEVRTFTFNDSLGLVVKWDNKTRIKNEAFIQGVASFPKDKQVRFHLKPSQLTVADLEWTLDPNNLVTVDTSTFEFTEFAFVNDRQSISLDGLISKDPKAALNIALRNFDLENFNLITSRSGITLDGDVSGVAQVSGLYAKPFFTNQLHVDSLILNDVMIGSGEINNTWIPATRSIQIFALLERKDKTSLSVIGEFLPGSDRKQNFNVKATVDQIPLSIFDPFVNKVMSDLKGIAKADLSVKGTTKEPILNGFVVLKDADLLFNYLNTRYRISDTVTVKKDGFYFNNLLVNDERDKEGRINGWVKHTNFKNFHFDANLVVDNFLALNTNSAMNSLYYGKGYGTGVVKFSGFPKDMHLEVAMRTDRGTRFHIPLFGAKNVNESDFITFVKPKGQEDEVAFEKGYEVDFKNLTMDLDIEVTPDAEIQLIFDPKVGDIIKGKGTGDIEMLLDKTGTFKMFGDYYINKGEYLFTLQNIINKKFLIQQGGTINWSGSPYEALVNIDAIYGVRTSLYDLMYPDTSNQNYKRRIQVDCLLKLTDNLLNPNISFDIDLPNSDEGTKTDVRNKIGVGNEQEMNRQVFGLLVLNRFFPTEDQNQALQQAGGFFSSSSAEMVSNQLSNWLSKISNDFDVGLNYRPGDEITSDELELALSTQLFNNRIIVDGNVGVANTSSSSNIVGDVNIEYKITEDGRFRVRAFNKSNDFNSINANAPFTQGVGLSYQKDFDRLGDLFRRRNKKKREEKIQ